MYLRYGMHVLRYGANFRKPTQCVKIRNASNKIWSQEPKADSM